MFLYTYSQYDTQGVYVYFVILLVNTSDFGSTQNVEVTR